MIVAIGVDVDETFARFVDQALKAEVPLRVVNLRAAVHGSWRFALPARESATIQYGDETVELDPNDSYYCRLIDLSSHESDVAVVRRWQGLLGALRVWLDSVPGIVVNKSNGGAHNSSKPLHETVLRELGFEVPDSITSSDRDMLVQFVRDGEAVSKTVCGVRADTARVSESDFDNFDPSSGPVHLQRLVEGDDARIHVIADQLIAQRVSADGVDYRRTGAIGEMEVFDPPLAIRDLLIAGTKKFGLTFSGWDFKIAESGRYWCFEANPMPGYSPYDSRCDGAISRVLLNCLQGG